ncbi:MAG TPA: bifunctional 3,4-dihydroxy-2-butanone-4-phosphate synthase/GTP cyclohydrolase II [Candidatus Eisenbacteria bacterium]|jgi:3,4-dihydroxy 2-butanone 4-phosphate synthase/GTP cyclohydrolase II|nr:bifunctional 3,4-dihydroxy-2-butanone-4-phosphate synthase/GTP cyclohydrolase II [Candidatus Eisenbacteria bacterium]
MRLSPIPEVLADLKKGKIIIVIDDADRENEGDFIVAAEHATAANINFMAKHGRGIICVPMESERLRDLGIDLMVQENADEYKTAWTVSIDAARGVTTGISAYDRSKTIQTLIRPETKKDDLVRPGHIFPLRAREGGVLVRAGHTEACVDLMNLAGLYPAGAICEIMNDDGTMARTPQLFTIAKKYKLKVCTIRDLIEYRRKKEKLVFKAVETRLTNDYGEFRLVAYESAVDKDYHVALILGDLSPDRPVLVRVHSECFTGDILGSRRCDCGEQLRRALEHIAKAKSGVLLYMRQEGRGIGLLNKLKAYQLQDQGLDTVQANERLGFPADLRHYGVGAQILADLGIRKIKLMTNNPKKIVGLEGYGLKVVERVPIQVKPGPLNRRYLSTKKKKMGHILDHA